MKVTILIEVKKLDELASKVEGIAQQIGVGCMTGKGWEIKDLD